MNTNPATPAVAPGPGHGPADAPPVSYGVLAGYATADELIAATKKALGEGYEFMDTFSPYPIADTADALGFPKSEMGVVMFIGGMTGACAGFIMQYWSNTFGYPLNVGGRPFFSWPSFVPITFEMMVLTAALSGLFGLVALCGLPRLHHPLFNSEKFLRATRDRFFLVVEAEDPKYDPAAVAAFLATTHPESVEEVFE